MKQNISYKAVILGFLADVTVSILLWIVMAILITITLGIGGSMVDKALFEEVGESMVVELAGTMLGLIGSIIGGYITAKIAKNSVYINALLMSVLGILSVIPLAFFTKQFDIYTLFQLVFYIPAVLLGAYVYLLRKRKYGFEERKNFKEIVKNLIDFKYQRTWREAVKYYLVLLLVFFLVAFFVSFSINYTNGTSFSKYKISILAVYMAMVPLIACLSLLILYKKNQLTLKNILITIISLISSVFIGVFLTLISVAYFSTLPSINLQEDNKTVQKNNLKTIFIVLITAAVMIFIAFRMYNQMQIEASIKNSVKDVLSGVGSEAQSEEAQFLAKFWEDSASLTREKFPALIALESTEVLQFNSFKTKESLKYYIDLLQNSIKEIASADTKNIEIRNEMRKKIEAYTIGSTDFKKGFLSGFEQSLNDEKRKFLISERTKTMKILHQDALNLYQFLYKNFNHYSIKEDEYGEEYIYFDDESYQDAYSNLGSKIQISTNNFLTADKEMMDYINITVNQTGLDIDAREVRDKYMKQ
jgi:MFS family permease